MTILSCGYTVCVNVTVSYTEFRDKCCLAPGLRKDFWFADLL